MNKITTNSIQKFEFYAIFVNNIFLLLGVSLFGWTLFDTLFLFWLEAISAIVLLGYLNWVVPIKYGRPGIQHLPEFRLPALKTLGLVFYTLILHYIVLVQLINFCQVAGWDTSQGVLFTLAQMPMQLWNGSLLLLTVVFLLAYLLPPLLLERRGIKPSIEVMPMQTKIMLHPSQFVMTYVWFGILWAVQAYGGLKEPIVLVAILVVLKSAYEAYLFGIVKNKN